jgi:hypothetical protein
MDKKDLRGNPVIPMSEKEYMQFLAFARKTQSILNFQESSFCKLVDIVSYYISNGFIPGRNNDLPLLKADLNKFRMKYYPFAFRENHNPIYSEGISVYKAPRMKSYMFDYNSIELDAFIMTYRACRNYIYGNFSEESEKKLIDKMVAISCILN